MDFHGKKLIVTGASQGLGAVCARAFADQGAGVALLSRSRDKLQDIRNTCNNPESHLVLSCDQTDQNQLEEAIGRIKETWGSVDAVLHCAGGGLGLREPLLSQTDIETLFKLNVSSVAQINRLIAPDMIEQGHGNLVHVGSVASFEAVASVGYNTAKAALAAYVRSLGRELASHKIIVTGIAPGGFIAPGNAMDRLRTNKPDVYQDFIAQRLPRNTMGKAEELISLLMFLCSEQASMMGGCMVPIDAGEGLSYGA